MFCRINPVVGGAPHLRALSSRKSAILVLFVAFLGSACASQPPQPGPFYNAPATVPSEPGQIVRVASLNTGVARANSYRILYSSRDRNDRPLVVSGMVLVPEGATPGAQGLPIVAWAHGTTGIANRCAPSLEPKAAMNSLFGVQDLVDAGYLVVATDYAGLGSEGSHAYLIGTSEGHAVLDAVKAVHNSSGWDAGSRYVIYGHSQGGHAALWATKLAPSYAPDLDLLGTAVLAPATDLGAILSEDIKKPAGKIFGAMALESWSRLYPNAQLSGIVKGPDVPLVDAIAGNCIETTGQGLMDLPAMELMGKDWLKANPTKTEPWESIIQENNVSPSGIDVPLFVAQGTSDQVIPPSVTTNWVKQMCTTDPDVDYQEYSDKGHVNVGPAAEPDVMAWIAGRFAGDAPPSDCASFR